MVLNDVELVEEIQAMATRRQVIPIREASPGLPKRFYRRARPVYIWSVLKPSRYYGLPGFDRGDSHATSQALTNLFGTNYNVVRLRLAEQRRAGLLTAAYQNVTFSYMPPVDHSQAKPVSVSQPPVAEPAPLSELISFSESPLPGKIQVDEPLTVTTPVYNEIENEGVEFTAGPEVSENVGTEFSELLKT